MLYIEGDRPCRHGKGRILRVLESGEAHGLETFRRVRERQAAGAKAGKARHTAVWYRVRKWGGWCDMWGDGFVYVAQPRSGCRGSCAT